MSAQGLLLKSLQTNAGLSIVFLRLLFGVIFFIEGGEKLFGWFGHEGGIYSVIGYFKDLEIPFPEFNAWLVGITELAGGIFVLLGFLTRLVSIPLGFTMVVAILTAHLEQGGWSYPALLLVSSLVLIQYGPGYFSLDSFLNKTFRNKIRE